MALPELFELAARQAGLVTRAQIRRCGLDHRRLATRLRSGDLQEVASNVFRVAGAPPTWHQELWLALLTAQAASVISHRSAARLDGIGRFAERPIDLVQVGDPPHRVEGAAPHRTLFLPPHHRTTLHGIPVTTTARTIFDLAGQVSAKRWRRGLPSLSRRQVERALDDALVRKVSYAQVDALLREVGGRGRGGTVELRTLLSYRGPGFVATESELEDLLVAVLARHGLPAPARQRNLGGEDRIGRVDFAYLAERVVIEVDGRRNHTALLDREGDQWRDLELASAGFQVLRVSWAQLRGDPGRFVAALRRVLDRRAAA